jgi:hypothetical protein
LSENIPFTFTLFVYFVDADETEVTSYWSMKEIQASEPVQLFTRPAPPYNVKTHDDTVHYDSVIMEWAEVDNVLN